MEGETSIIPEHVEFFRHLEKTNPKLYRAVAPDEWLPPLWEACLHEAAHAAIMYACGERVARIRCKGHSGGVTPDREGRDVPSNFDVIVSLLAGDLAEPDGEILSVVEWRKTVEDVLAGRRVESHDNVAAVTIARGEVQDHADVEAILSVILAARIRTIELLQTPEVWASIVCIAEHLRIAEEMSGKRVHELCSIYFPFGAYK